MSDDVYFARFQNRQPDAERTALPQDLVVRPAAPEDRDGLAALVLERQGGTYEELRQNFEKELAAGGEHNLVLVAQSEGQLVGFGRARHFEPPLDSPTNCAPPGWYLLGVIVTPAFRRRGVGAELTRQRLQWIRERSGEAFYFANARNQVAIAMHDRFGFVELARDFAFPGATFSGGVGVLYRVDLSAGPQA